MVGERGADANVLRSARDTAGYIAGKRCRGKDLGRMEMEMRTQAESKDDARSEGDTLSRLTVGSRKRPASSVSITLESYPNPLVLL